MELKWGNFELIIKQPVLLAIITIIANLLGIGASLLQ